MEMSFGTTGLATGMEYLMITSPATLNATDMFVPITVLGMIGVGPVY